MQSCKSVIHDGPTAPQLFLAALRQNPEQLAVKSGNTEITYGELESRSWQMVRALQQQGLKRQDTVALLLGNRPEALIALLAVQLMGVKYLSLHPMASPDDHRFVLEDAAASAVIVDNHGYADRLPLLNTAGATTLALGDSSNGSGLIQQASTMDDAPMSAPSDPSAVFRLSYTGGTTGRSKGILHTHRTTVTMVMQMLAAYEWPESPKYLVTTPISHAAGSLLLLTFLKGGTVYFMEKYTPTAFLELVERYRINFSFLVPTQIYGLLDCPGVSEFDHSSLSLVLYGASPITQTRLKQALETFGQIFGQLYGQAEAPMTISYLSKKDHDLNHPNRLRSCGKVVVGNQVQLLGENLEPVPTGEIGELCVRSPLIMEGYLNRPEENEKVFSGGWLHTGDMARMDAEGYLYLVDRSKDMIITGGFNVYPSEVENCLAQHPAVALSAVIGMPHEKWGEQVVAVVVTKAGMPWSEQDLITYVTQHKGVVNAPKSVVFVDELPLTAIGKIDKKALRTRYWGEHDRQIN